MSIVCGDDVAMVFPWPINIYRKGGWFCDEGPADVCCVSSGVTFEETTYACPAESGAGGPGDAVSLWTTGPPHQGTAAAGRMHHLHQSVRIH